MSPEDKKDMKEKDTSSAGKESSAPELCGCLVVDPCGCYVEPCACFTADNSECYETSCGCINFR